MDITTLIDYDEWANRKVFNAIKGLEAESYEAELYKQFAHLLATQIVWMSRITGNSSKLAIWPDLSIHETETLMNENPKKLKNLISRKDTLITYKNSRGEEFQNSVEEILMHLTIHGQHHRAQIAKLLRKAGTSPPGTDFIFFLRTLHN